MFHRKNGSKATRVDGVTGVPYTGALLCSSVEKARIIYPGHVERISFFSSLPIEFR